MFRLFTSAYVLCLLIYMNGAVKVEHTRDAIVFAQADWIGRMLIPTHETEDLYISDLQDVQAVDFDIKNNCVIWSTKKQIKRQCMEDPPELLHEVVGSSIGRIAYDWTSELVYFTRASLGTIEVIGISYRAPDFHHVILELPAGSKPRGLAIHPGKGYLFYTSKDPWQISRANLDGSNVKLLFSHKYAHAARVITVDFTTEHILWTNSREKSIYSGKLDGTHVNVLLRSSRYLARPLALAVLDGHLYWNDDKFNVTCTMQIEWNPRQDSAVSKNGVNIIIDNDDKKITVINPEINVRDMRAVATSIQTGSNACIGEYNTCSHYCIAGPNNEYGCLCPNGLELSTSGQCLCPGGALPDSANHCLAANATCGTAEFECTNQECVPDFKICDGENDCTDGSDEDGCDPCLPNWVQCECDGRCIPEKLRCDGLYQCADGSDEKNCTNTTIDSSQKLAVLNLKFDSESSTLTWDPPAIPNPEYQYTVYYGGSWDNCSKGPEITTTKLEAVLNVQPCSKYIVGVSVIENNKRRLPDGWLRILTRYDDRLSPRNPQKTVKGRIIEFSWEPGCSYSPQPPYYLFRVHEVTLNRSSITHVEGRDHRFRNVWMGGDYVFSVSAPVDGAEAAIWKHKALLPTPGKLDCLSDGTGTFFCDWESVELDRISYEVVVVRGTEMNDTTPIVWNVCLEKPPLITEFAHLTRFLSVETDFVIGVRIKTALGYYSAVRGTQLIHLRPQADCGILHGCQEHIVDGWAGDRRSRAADCIAHLE